MLSSGLGVRLRGALSAERGARVKEVVLEFGGRAIASARIALDGARHDPIDRDVRARQAHRRQLPGEDRHENGARIGSGEGARPGEASNSMTPTA